MSTIAFDQFALTRIADFLKVRAEGKDKEAEALLDRMLLTATAGEENEQDQLKLLSSVAKQVEATKATGSWGPPSGRGGRSA